MKTSPFLLVLFISAAATCVYADPQFLDQTDSTRLTCANCASNSSNSFGYNTYASQRALVTTVQVEQARENAVREYATSSQAPKDAALARANEAAAAQREKDRTVTLELKSKEGMTWTKQLPKK